MKLKILEVNMSRKKDANKYWIYGEDAALAAQFTAYLATVLKNRRLTYIRHLKKIQKVECSYEYAAETIEHVDSIREESLESAVEAKLMWEAIKPYLHKLSPKECEVMICLYIDRLSIADTATKLKIKPDTVSTHKHNPPQKGGRRSRRGKRRRPPARLPQPFLSCFFSPCSAHLSLFVIFLLRCQRQKLQRLFVFVLMGKGNIQLLFATDADALYHVNERPAV